jgi:hypothetical protein
VVIFLNGKAQQTHGDTLPSFLENRQEGRVIIVCTKDLLPSHGAVEYVKDVTSGTESRAPRHDGALHESSVCPLSVPIVDAHGWRVKGSGVVFG